LPAGMSLSSAGVLSGTRTPAAGLFPIIVTGTDGPSQNSVAVTIQVLTQGFTLLGDGTVLLAAGDDTSFKQLSAAEIFNPSSGTLTATADLTARRRLSVATVLTNGQVLVTGGDNDSGALATAELYH